MKFTKSSRFVQTRSLDFESTSNELTEEMATAPNIRKPMPRKPPAKRAFSGMAGSPLASENAQNTAQARTLEIVAEPAQTPPPAERETAPKSISTSNGSY